MEIAVAVFVLLLLLFLVLRTREKRQRAANLTSNFMSSAGQEYQISGLESTKRERDLNPNQIVRRLIQAKSAIIRYVDARGAETERLINPIRLESKGSVTYLIARCDDFDDVRSFRADRIVSAVILSDD